MLSSGMNQLVRVKGIIVCLEQSVLQLQLVIWLSLVLMVCLLLGVNFIRQFGASSFFTLNMQLRRSNHVLDLTESSPNSWQIFSQDVPWMAHVIANVALYCKDSNFLQIASSSGWSYQGFIYCD